MDYNSGNLLLILHYHIFKTKKEKKDDNTQDSEATKRGILMWNIEENLGIGQ